MATTVEKRQFKSSRPGSAALYTAVVYDDGTASCDCPGWRFQRSGQPRGCKHTATMLTGTTVKVVTNAEMARMALRGEQFNVIKRWTIAQSGAQMVSLRMGESASAEQTVRRIMKEDNAPQSYPARRDRWSQAEGKWVSVPKKMTPEMRTPDPLAARDFFPSKPKPQTTRRAEQIEQPTRARLAFDEEV